MSELILSKLGTDLNCRFLSGFAFKSHDFVSNGVPLIKIGNIQNKRVSPSLSVDHFPSQLIDNSIKDFYLQNGDILIAMTGQGSVGRIGKLILEHGEMALLNQRVGKFICDERLLNKEYLFYILTTDLYQDCLFGAGTGSGQPNLSPEVILETEIPAPSYKEQKAVASLLSSLDDKIDLLNRQNKTLEAMAETLFQQWFVNGAVEGWVQKPLSSIAEFLNGLACQKYPPENAIDRLPVLKIRELSGGISETSDWATSKIRPEYIVETGDVIFAWSASLMVKIWAGERCVLNQHLFKVSSTKYPKWFYLMWCKHHLDEFISISSSHATTMGHIKRGDLDSAMVVVPSPEEIKEMSRTMEPIIENQISNFNQVKTLEKLRYSLLSKFISGEVQVEVN